MANISTIRPDTMKVPVNYPKVPAPGKISIIWDENKRSLYRKLSPYGDNTFLFIKTRQPFVYKYPDEKVGTMDKYAMREFPFGRAITDVERVFKWMISGQGVLWLGKQFLLQTGNPFNETRIYNPTSPVVCAALPLTLWTARPTRHIDTSDLLGSFLGGFGRTIGGLFGMGNKPPQPPPGTIGSSLPTNNQWGAKGLLRAGTANKAKTLLMSKWSPPSQEGLSFGGFLSNTLKTIFGNFFPQRQDGIIKRSDETAYGLMLTSTSGDEGFFTYQGASGPVFGVQQFWMGGSTSADGIRRGRSGGRPLNWVKIYTDENGRPIFESPRDSFQISGLTGNVGYSITRIDKPIKYGDYVGTTKNKDWEKSDVLIQHSYYVEENRKYPSKLTDKQNPQVVSMKDSLDRIINQIKNTNVYTVNTSQPTSVVSFNQSKIGYDKIVSRKYSPGKEPEYSVAKEYRERKVRVLDYQFTDDPVKLSMKMASSGKADGINKLKVLDGEKVRSEGWEEWKPYRDDLIAFYFYDIVNDKYIPFRATIRGLQESSTANWEELSFIGRADRLYSYGGFNRALNFSFTVHISSLSELSPTWQRINYLMSLVKPSNYTSRPDSKITSTLYTKYIVPPMVMLTIGDMYKNQPVVIASAGITIPDQAIWETLNEENSPNGWSYLADYIEAPGILYGQFPRTADISINCHILEKERAIAGAANFGHAPHREEYQKDQYRGTPPDFYGPNKFNKSLVVYQEQKKSVT